MARAISLPPSITNKHCFLRSRGFSNESKLLILGLCVLVMVSPFFISTFRKLLTFPRNTKSGNLNLELLHPSSWKDYELIDCGDTEKLERFGDYVLIRPEPQALWPKSLSDNEWNKLAHARFDREQKDKFRFRDDVNGGWQKKKPIPESWHIKYQYNNLTLTLRLALTSFGHVGVFPEQGTNWNFIYDTISGW